MIKKIVASFFLICLFIAIPLAVMGIKKVEPGVAFQSFMVSLNKHYETWKLDIPNIPQITLIENANGWTLVLNFLINVWNIITNILNIILVLINVIINVIQFICTFLFEIGYFIAYLIDHGDSSYDWVWSSSLPIL